MGTMSGRGRCSHFQRGFRGFFLLTHRTKIDSGKPRSKRKWPGHAGHQQWFVTQKGIQPPNHFNSGSNSRTIRSLFGRSQVRRQLAFLHGFGPTNFAGLIRFVPLRRAPQRFRFEKRIEIARHSIRSQLRANLPKGVGNFRRIV